MTYSHREEPQSARPTQVRSGTKPAHAEPVEKSLHEALIDVLVEHMGASRFGFGKAVRTILGRTEPERIVPDAFVVDRARKAVVVYEVEITHGITESKAAKLTRLAWHLNGVGWLLVVIEIDKHGRDRGYCPSFDEINRVASLVQDGERRREILYPEPRS